MRVLITHRYFWPENLSLYPLMLKDIAQWHCDRGDSVTVFTAEATCVDDRQRRAGWCRELGIRLIETPLPVDRGLSGFQRAIHAARYGAAMTQLMWRERFDLTFVGSYPPILPGLIARTIGRYRGSPFIYYVQDILPESIQRKHAGYRVLAGVLKATDRPSMNAAVATITLSDNMKQTLANRGVTTGKIHVLPNYAIDAAGDSTARGRQPVTIIYAGNHGRLQNLHAFLRAVKLASAKCDFRVQMLGDGSELPALKQLVLELRCDNVEFLAQQPREEAQQIIARADVGFVGAQPGLYDVAYPSKMMSYLRAGLPVLVHVAPHSEMANFIESNQLGMAASPSSEAQAARAITELVTRIQAGRSDRTTIAARANEIYSKENYFARYEQVIAASTRQAA